MDTYSDGDQRNDMSESALNLQPAQRSNRVPDPDRAYHYRRIARQVREYTQARPGRAVFELLVTVVPFAALFVLAAVLWSSLPGVSVALTVPMAVLAVRLFMLQHDMGHGAFFGQKALNLWLGRMLGVLSGIPFSYWRRTHDMHHATSGNLDERGAGDVTTWTLEEYQQAGFWGQLGYRFYRHPVVMVLIAPAYLLLKFRVPFGHPTPFRENWRSMLINNLLLTGIVLSLGWLVGFWFVLAVYVLTLYLAMMIGVWLFYVQHQFEDVYWAREGDWHFQTAAVESSSQLVMPDFVQWLTANISLHHIHHLNSAVPFYRLQEVMRDIPELQPVNRVSWRETPRLLTLTLYDEARRQLVDFRAARTI